MARIVDADKVELVRTLTLEEYNTKVRFSLDTEMSGRIETSVEDPRVTARNTIRRKIEARQQEIASIGEDPSDDLAFVLKILDDEDAATQFTWGENKGKQQPFTATLWFDSSIADVLENMFAGQDINSRTRTTIRESLAVKSDTKGF